MPNTRDGRELVAQIKERGAHGVIGSDETESINAFTEIIRMVAVGVTVRQSRGDVQAQVSQLLMLCINKH